MAKCEICSKTSVAGNNISHSNRHTKRRFLPNVRKMTLNTNGHSRRVRLCTRCLRTMYKPPRA